MHINLHFNIEADTDRNIMVEKIYGTWTVETAHDYHEEFKSVVSVFKGKKWAKIINLSNWKSSYPEMVKVIGEHLKWCRENGMVLSVNIIENPVTKNQLRKMFSIGGTEDISQIVRSREEAEKVLTENGF